MRYLALVASLMLMLSTQPALAKPAFLDVSPIWKEAAQTKNPVQLRALRRQKQVIKEEFPFNAKQAFSAMRKAFPQADFPMVTDAFIKHWLQRDDTICARIDGKKRYFEALATNALDRNFALAHEWMKKEAMVSPFEQTHQYVFRPRNSGIPVKDWQPYVTPVRYLLTLRVDIPRNKLPSTGNVRIWIPIPITTASQRNVRIVSVSPEDHLVTRPRTDANIGCAVMDFALKDLKHDLRVEAVVLFDSYTQIFRVDPHKVLPYQRESAIYRTYTASGPNIRVTPEITALAKVASKGEKNPYLAARNIYYYVIKNIHYSLIPHGTLWILGYPESEWVRKTGLGDCGAQSMFFSALCRSLGIPARATGGYQLFPYSSGPHFWAEFYLEGYGWIPVDDTMAEASDWNGAITEQQRSAFKKFYFGNLDPFRMVIQKDVDLPLVPEPRDNWLTGKRPLMILQKPWLDCTGCKENPLVLVSECFHWKVTPVNR